MELESKLAAEGIGPLEAFVAQVLLMDSCTKSPVMPLEPLDVPEILQQNIFHQFQQLWSQLGLRAESVQRRSLQLLFDFRVIPSEPFLVKRDVFPTINNDCQGTFGVWTHHVEHDAAAITSRLITIKFQKTIIPGRKIRQIIVRAFEHGDGSGFPFGQLREITVKGSIRHCWSPQIFR